MCATGYAGTGLTFSSGTNDDWFWGLRNTAGSEMFISKMDADILSWSIGENFSSSDYTPNHMQWFSDYLIWASSTSNERVLIGIINFTSGNISSRPPASRQDMFRPEVPWDILDMKVISITEMYVMARANDGAGNIEAHLGHVDIDAQNVILIETFFIIDHNDIAAAVLDAAGTGGYFSGTSNYLRSYGCD